LNPDAAEAVDATVPEPIAGVFVNETSAWWMI
jgi:hypothetical protein